MLYIRHCMRRARPADSQAIDDLIKARHLRVISVKREDDYWRYWSRGWLFSLSNCARIYVVVAEASAGQRRELHVAFDDWPPKTWDLQILMERELPPRIARA